MTGVLVDSNVILDILTQDPNWYPWSEQQLIQCATLGELVINPIIYAEVSISFASPSSGTALEQGQLIYFLGGLPIICWTC